MKDDVQKALDRMEAALDRPARRRRRGFSTAPFVVAGGLTLGYQLLVRLVPMLWANILPGGFEEGARFQGLPHLVWWMAWFCHLRFAVVLLASCLIVGTSFALGRGPLTRPMAWLMAVGVIVLNAAILLIALRTGMIANGLGRVLG